MLENYEVKEFTHETWVDFDALFGKHKGVSGGCWCTFNLITSSQFNKMHRDERKEMQHQLTETGQSCGLLIYDEGVPVGWCQYGPAENFIRLERARAYQELAIPPEWKPPLAYLLYFCGQASPQGGIIPASFKGSTGKHPAKGRWCRGSLSI